MQADPIEVDGIFTKNSPYVALDSRRDRPVLPTTAASLNLRHAYLLPRSVVEGLSVLDLGACIAATGHWSLTLGASRYVGIEHQIGFASIATQLHTGNPRAQILCADTEAYLADAREEFDVVCMLGLVHGLFDPLATIRRAASRARRYVCFEDFGVIGSEPYLMPSSSMRMPIAGESAGTVGFGWSINSSAMELIMAFLGFAPDCAPYPVSPSRWLCRYVRISENSSRSASYATEKQPWT